MKHVIPFFILLTTVLTNGYSNEHTLESSLISFDTQLHDPNFSKEELDRSLYPEDIELAEFMKILGVRDLYFKLLKIEKEVLFKELVSIKTSGQNIKRFYFARGFSHTFTLSKYTMVKRAGKWKLLAINIQANKDIKKLFEQVLTFKQTEDGKPSATDIEEIITFDTTFHNPEIKTSSFNRALFPTRYSNEKVMSFINLRESYLSFLKKSGAAVDFTDTLAIKGSGGYVCTVDRLRSFPSGYIKTSYQLVKYGNKWKIFSISMQPLDEINTAIDDSFISIHEATNQ